MVHVLFWNRKLAFCPLKLPECNRRNPPQNATCNAPQNTKLQRKCCVDAISGHFWQRTSNDGNYLATHLKIRIQCPEPTPNYALATGNAPETTKRTSNHIAHSPANMQLEQRSGKGTLGEGTPEKDRVKVEKQPETNRNANQSWIWTNHDF